MSVLVVGIGGASCSGKSTLCNNLSQLLLAPIIHQDRFYKSDSLVPIHAENGLSNWDSPQAIDCKAFLECLRAAADIESSIVGPNRPQISALECPDGLKLIIAKIHEITTARSIKIVLVDGFLIYHTLPLVEAFGMKIFMTTSFDTLKARREERCRKSAYVTSDGFWADPPTYFQDVVWPMYITYNHLVYFACTV